GGAVHTRNTASMPSRPSSRVSGKLTPRGGPPRASAELVSEARSVDAARATENKVWVIRADVAGRSDELVSYGSSHIIDPDGMVDMVIESLGAEPTTIKDASMRDRQ